MLWFAAGCSGAFCDCDDTHISILAVQEVYAWLVLQPLQQTLRYIKNFWSRRIRTSANGYLKSSRLMQGLPGLPTCLVTCNEWVTPAFWFLRPLVTSVGENPGITGGNLSPADNVSNDYGWLSGESGVDWDIHTTQMKEATNDII